MFKKGNTQGRKKGVGNKKRDKDKVIIKNIVDGNRHQFEKMMDKLEPKDFCQIYLHLLEFVQPKMHRVDVEGTERQQIKIYLMPARVNTKKLDIPITEHLEIADGEIN